MLKPGGIFGIYDVMRESGDGDLSFPVPWASSPDTSFVESAVTYRCLLESAGFAVQKERSRREFAVEFFREMAPRYPRRGTTTARPPHPHGHVCPAEGREHDRQSGAGADRTNGDYQPRNLVSRMRKNSVCPSQATYLCAPCALRRASSRSEMKAVRHRRMFKAEFRRRRQSVCRARVAARAQKEAERSV